MSSETKEEEKIVIIDDKPLIDNKVKALDEIDLENHKQIKLRTLGKIFTLENIKQRADDYVSHYLKVEPTHYQYKAMRKMLTEVLLSDNRYIQSQISIAQNKPPPKITRRSIKQRNRTEYQKFCEFIKSNTSHEDHVGKIQGLWQKYKKGEVLDLKTKELVV